MAFIILASIVILVVSLFIGGSILLLVTKLFKIDNASYKKSLSVLFFSGVAAVLVRVIFSLINLGALSLVIVIVASFFAFHYFLQRYYQNTWKKSLGIYIIFNTIALIASLLIFIPTRLYIISTSSVTGEAMSPTYNNGDYLLINKFDKRFSRGDVVVFRLDKSKGVLSIKRIVGLPSEKVEIKNGEVFINGQILNENYSTGATLGDMSVTLANDQYFVLGDNREKSSDSRISGPITKSSIEGVVFYKYKDSSDFK